MKKKILALLAAIGMISLVGCQTSTSESLTYDVLNEQVKVKLNTSDGYKLVNTGSQFEITDKNGNVISTGMFADEVTYEYYKDIVCADPQGYGMEEKKINGSDCLYFSVNGEYNHLVDIADSDVYVIIGSIANENDSKTAMSRLTFESLK